MVNLTKGSNKGLFKPLLLYLFKLFFKQQLAGSHIYAIIITELPSISKPYDKNDYTSEWKQGLFSWYQSIVKELLGYDAITIEIDYDTY